MALSVGQVILLRSGRFAAGRRWASEGYALDAGSNLAGSWATAVGLASGRGERRWDCCSIGRAASWRESTLERKGDLGRSASRPSLIWGRGDVTNCLGTLKRSFPPNGKVHSGDPAEGAVGRSTIRPPSLKTGLKDFDDRVYKDCHELSYNRSPFIDDDGSGSGIESKLQSMLV
ncbi:uncharacterized protein A4U43_C08F14580 [Asparagus officinalis]|nr:uncharacterized protein A4U43_C08F14580 [Asparagus officinalis]